MNFPTDHRLVRAFLLLRKIRKSRTKYTNRLRNSLKTETEISTYKLSLEKYEDVQYQDDVGILANYDNIIRSIEKSLHIAQTTEQ